MSATKEGIKDRMMRTAARVWGIPDNEIDISFDPLILLLIDACAAEFEKIGNDIAASQSRLLNRLTDLILPESILGPRPASAVMHAFPVEKELLLKPSTHFYSRNSAADSNENRNSESFFTPVGAFPLFRVSLDYMLTGSKLYGFNEANHRTLLHRGEGSDRSEVNEIWIALKPDTEIESINGLGIFLDMRSLSEARNFYNSLKEATAETGGKRININRGYFLEDQFGLSTEEMLVSGHDYCGKIMREIAGVYEQQFLYLSGVPAVSTVKTTNIPAEWQGIPQKILQQIGSEERVYIKITLDRPFQRQVLDTLSVTLNAFPVVNRKLHTINYRTNDWVNIIPLVLEGLFLDMEDISSQSGRYNFRVSKSRQDLEAGEASVRSSGIGKADSKEVREITNLLIETIRDESAFFSELSNELILSKLTEINQILTRLESQLTASKDMKAPHHYVLLRPGAVGELVILNYWTTLAEAGNGVKAATQLEPYNHALVDRKSAFLLTNTLGGKSGVSEDEKKRLLKKQIIAKDRVVSAEDVKLACYHFFGSRLEQVSVKKGVAIGAKQSQGFVRTIDVFLSLQEEKRPPQDEIAYAVSSLENYLKQHASPVFPFRIFVQ